MTPDAPAPRPARPTTAIQRIAELDLELDQKMTEAVQRVRGTRPPAPSHNPLTCSDPCCDPKRKGPKA